MKGYKGFTDKKLGKEAHTDEVSLSTVTNKKVGRISAENLCPSGVAYSGLRRQWTKTAKRLARRQVAMQPKLSPFLVYLFTTMTVVIRIVSHLEWCPPFRLEDEEELGCTWQDES